MRCDDIVVYSDHVNRALQMRQLIHMLKTAWKVVGVSNKLSVFVKGPGWEPGKPRLGYIEDIPDVSSALL